jgi:hypothetical protein
MRKSQSTKLAEPIPVEFERVFVEHGWERANRIFGKRATTRYFTALGADRLRADRNAYRAIGQLAGTTSGLTGASPLAKATGTSSSR